jgi:hypothetical protein
MQFRSNLDDKIAPILASLERSLERMGRSDSAEHAKLIAELKQVVGEIRKSIQAPKR